MVTSPKQRFHLGLFRLRGGRCVSRLELGGDKVLHLRVASAVADGVAYWPPGDERRQAYVRYGKRGLDLALCLIILPVVVLLVAALAAVVALDGASPFFAHTRVGRGGKSFGCLKLRSMVPDAQQRLEALLEADPAARAEWTGTRKLARDPRVTRFGRLLRRTSLDELPQIVNVFRGEMSLVGPRPVPADELVRYGHHVDAYLALRPGVTGLWQTMGRNELSYQKRVQLDCVYKRRLCLLLDLRILAKTVTAVLRRTGL